MIASRQVRKLQIRVLGAVARVRIAGAIGLAMTSVSLLWLAFIAHHHWATEQSLAREYRLAEAELKAGGTTSRPTLEQAPRAGERQLPTLSATPGILAEIFQHSRDRQIPISAAEYQYTPATQSSPGQYEISFHLRSRYLPMRELIQDILNTQPAVALREISFARDNLAQPDLDTSVRLVIFLRPERI